MNGFVQGKKAPARTEKKNTKRAVFNRIRKSALFLVDVVGYIMLDILFYLVLGIVPGAPHYDMDIYLRGSGVLFAILFGLRLLCRTYNIMWRYSDTRAYLKLVLCDALGTAVALIAIVTNGWNEMVLQIITVTPLVCLLTLCARFLYRLVYKRLNASAEVRKANKSYTNIAIVGAGQLGISLVHVLQYSMRTVYRPVCFIDIDPIKIGKRISELPVYGGSDSNLAARLATKNVSEIVIAINELDKERAHFLFHHYEEMGYGVKIYDTPVMDNNRKSNDYVIRDFQIEDLLFRESIQYNQSLNYYAGKTILVTGGGGSIGSELCRRLAVCNPGKLVIFDIYENNAYDIQQELLQTYGNGLALSVEIGSVRDRARLDYVFKTYRPEIVFHAAAHKHVPLMEQSACEAIKNNIFGTYNTADMAEKYGVERFILISSDKAVNPTNIMGATKRMCEMLIQCRNDSRTRFASVRFGNVLGSNGSVIPLFKKQIQSGGPVTITDRRIIRYFMTIPEASQLLLQAGTMAQRGELFVLDMGEPVKIYELAQKMIRLCGLEPGKDIEIKEIGLRPGEKLYEELLIKSEKCIKTTDDKIFIEHDTPLTREAIEEYLELLRRTVDDVESGRSDVSVRDILKGMVLTYMDADVVNAKGTAPRNPELCAIQ